jgi:hypothetical protein
LCSTSCTVERGICYCKPAALIDLRGSRWNASLMRLPFSSEVLVIPEDFTRKILSVVLSLLSQSRMFFRIGGFRPYCVLKLRWTAVRYCNSARHNTHSACSCCVDIVTELAGGHQLAHARKSGMEKLSEFSFPTT